MSSIYGAWFSRDDINVQKAAARIKNITSWWNPDQKFDYVDTNIILGQQTLFTQNIQRLESQKIFSHPSNLKIVSDARIDNRAELMSKLKINEQISNSELILESYLKFGSRCTQHLIGAFTFVIWDEKKQKFFCARDQMGVKSFVYYRDETTFAFATQKKSITSIPNLKRNANWKYIFHSMSSMLYPSEDTAYTHIKYLLPGHQMIITPDHLHIEKYWELDAELVAPHKSEQDYIYEFRQHIKEAIKCRMEGNQTIGAHLSGGLDSSGITAVAEEISLEQGIDTKVFSYNVHEDYDGNKKMLVENLLAFDVVEKYKLHHKFINVHEPLSRTYKDFVLDEAQSCDGLSQSNNVNTEYEIQAAAHQADVNVVLSGFPGDELVTSFARPYFYEYLQRQEYFNFLFNTKDSRLNYKHKAKTLVAALGNNIAPKLMEKIYFQLLKKQSKKRKYHGRSIFLNREYLIEKLDFDMFNPDYRMIFDQSNYKDFSLRKNQKNHVSRPHTSRRMESEQLAGLKWKVSYRYPLTDIRLLQFVLSLPMEMKISKNMTRRIFRLGMKGYLPESIRLRDYKYAGSLKPLMRNMDRNPDGSELKLWNQYKASQKIPFLNHKLIDKWFENKRSGFGLLSWMIYAQLSEDKKIDF